MTLYSKATAKTFFETGDRPSETNFSDLIDSVVFQPVSGNTLKTGFLEAVSTAEATAWSSAGAFPITATVSGATTPRTLSTRFAERVHVKEYGAKGDDSTDDRDAIRAAIDDIESSGVRTLLDFRDSSNTTYKSNTGLGTIDLGLVCMRGPAEIDFSALAASPAMTWTSTKNAFLNTLTAIEQMRFTGPGKGGGIDCVLFSGGGSSLGVNRVAFRQIYFHDWQDIIEWGDDAFQTYWESCLFRTYNRAVHIPSGLSNSISGENFVGCRFGGGGSGALAFQLDVSGDIYVYGGVMDGTHIAKNTNGRLYLNGVHIEELDAQKWTQPPIWIAGGAGTQVIMHGGSLQSSATNPADGVTAVLRNDNAQTDPSRIQLLDARVDAFTTITDYLSEGPGNVDVDRRISLTTLANKKFLGYPHNSINNGEFSGTGTPDDLFSVESGTGGATITDRLNTTNLDISKNTAAVRHVDFDGTTAVDTGTDIITLPANNGYYLAKPVNYNNNANPDIGGLTSGTTYYWIPVTATTGKLATSEANALAGTAINLTATATGTHSLKSNLRGLLLDVKAGSPKALIAKPIRPNQSATCRFYHELTAAGTWTFNFMYGVVAFDADGLLEIVDSLAVIQTNTLTDTAWAVVDAERNRPAPRGVTHIIMEFDVSGLGTDNLHLDDILLNIQ